MSSFLELDNKFKWSLIVSVLILNLLHVGLSSESGSGRRGKFQGALPRYRIQKTTSRGQIITNIEKPPLSTNKLKSSQTFDESGVTVGPSSLSPKNDLTQENMKRTSNVSSLSEKLSRLRSVFKRLSNVMKWTRGDDASTGRHADHSFMDGAMVPMTFLLMAAFIMDILQRLFPLPYASFVHSHVHGPLGRHGLPDQPASAAAPVQPPPDLSQFEFKTPVGSLGVSTNDKKKEAILGHLFGRSNQGYTDPDFPVVAPENQYSTPLITETSTYTGDPVTDLIHLTNLNAQQQQFQQQQFHQQQEQPQYSEQYHPQEQVTQFQQSQQQDEQQHLLDQLKTQQEREQEAEKLVSSNSNDGDANSVAKIDYIDYYSRFDENGQQPQQET